MEVAEQQLLEHPQSTTTAQEVSRLSPRQLSNNNLEQAEQNPSLPRLAVVDSFSASGFSALRRAGTLPPSVGRSRLGIEPGHTPPPPLQQQLQQHSSPNSHRQQHSNNNNKAPQHAAKATTAIPSVNAIGANASPRTAQFPPTNRNRSNSNQISNDNSGANYADANTRGRVERGDARLIQQVLEAVREGGEPVLRHVLSEWALRIAACESEVADYFNSKLKLETMHRVLEQQSQRNSDLEHTCDALQFRLQNVVAVAAAGGGGSGASIGDLPLYSDSNSDSAAADPGSTSTSAAVSGDGKKDNREILLRVTLQTMLDSIDDPATPPSEQSVTLVDVVTGAETTQTLLLDPNDLPVPRPGDDLVTQLHAMRTYALRMRTKQASATSKLELARGHLRKQHEDLSKASDEAARWKAQAATLRGVCADVKRDLESERIARKKQVDTLSKELGDVRRRMATFETASRADAKSLGAKVSADMTALNRTNQSLSLEVDRLRQFERRSHDADAAILALERQVKAEREGAASSLEAEQRRYYNLRAHVETSLYRSASMYNELSLQTKIKLPDAALIPALDASVPSLREDMGEALLDQQLYDLRTMLGCVRKLLEAQLRDDPDVQSLMQAEERQLRRIHERRTTVDRMLLRLGGVDGVSDEYRDDIKEMIAEELRLQRLQAELEERTRLEAEAERERQAALESSSLMLPPRTCDSGTKEEAEAVKDEGAPAVQQNTSNSLKSRIAEVDLENEEKHKARVAAKSEELHERNRKQFESRDEEKREQGQAQETANEEQVKNAQSTTIGEAKTPPSSAARDDLLPSSPSPSKEGRKKAHPSPSKHEEGGSTRSLASSDKATSAAPHEKGEAPRSHLVTILGGEEEHSVLTAAATSKDAIRSKIVEKVRGQTSAARTEKREEGTPTVAQEREDEEEKEDAQSVDSWNAELSVISSSEAELKQQQSKTDEAKTTKPKKVDATTASAEQAKTPSRTSSMRRSSPSFRKSPHRGIARTNSDRWRTGRHEGKPTDVDAAADDDFVARAKKELADRRFELERREALAGTFEAPIAVINQAERTRSDAYQEFGERIRTEREANLLRCKELLGLTQVHAKARLSGGGPIGGVFADLDSVVIDTAGEFGSPKPRAEAAHHSQPAQHRSVGATAKGKLMTAASVTSKFKTRSAPQGGHGTSPQQKRQAAKEPVDLTVASPGAKQAPAKEKK